jgi:hypothetical protein
MGFRPITEQEFLRIKKMVADSGTVDGTRRKLKRSWDTVNRIARSETFLDYKHGNVSVTSEPAIVVQLRQEQAIINDQFESVITTLLRLHK